MKDPSPWLSQLSHATLVTIEEAIDAQTLRFPLSRSNVMAMGLGEHAQTLETVFSGLSRSSALALLGAVISERLNRQKTVLQLVWTGPLTSQTTHRDTGAVMRQLFARAEHEVLIGGFRFDAGADLFEPLHRSMVERGVNTKLFLDIEGSAESKAAAPAFAAQRIDAFFDKNWPFGNPKPDVFYDPRTALIGPPWVSLHAKCVVVDERWSLVTSANFTDRAQTRNIELGVLIDDRAFAQRVAGLWRALITEGHVRGVE